MQVSSTGGNTFTLKAFLPVPVVKEVLVTHQTHFKSDLLILCIENLHPQGLGGEPLWRSVFPKPPPHKPLGPAWLRLLVLAKQGLISKTGQVQCLVLSLFRFPPPVFGKVPIFTHCVEHTDFFISTLLTSSLGCCRFLEAGLGVWWNVMLLALQRKSVP